MNKSNSYVILFRFAQMLGYIFQTSEKNNILALYYGEVKRDRKGENDPDPPEITGLYRMMKKKG